MLILYALYLPIFVYATFTKSKRYFFPLWIVFIVFNFLLILFHVYYLVGFKSYRKFLSQLEYQIGLDANYCNVNVCQKTNCIRLATFSESKQMSLAFIIIDLLMAICTVITSVVCNRKRRKSNDLELII